MGVNFHVEKSWLPETYRTLPLRPTKYGCSASVYYLGENYLLKILSPGKSFTEELTLGKYLQHLPVSRPLEQFTLAGRKAAVYYRLEGTHPTVPSAAQIENIGTFLSALHKSTIPPLALSSHYHRKSLSEKIKQSGYAPFQKHYLKLQNIPLSPKTLIHGDLFRDNTLFKGERLIGVIDWSDAGWGDWRFELGVVALDWCFQGNKLDSKKLSALLKGYQKDNITAEQLRPYISYALLYYAVTRYLSHKNYLELLEKLESLHA